ncbi:hypothetical protein HOT99_gp038 [Caulobacter phage CcrBL10]|uniref:Uncharacterized protein n=1 Tax=Caulobacter phage CcrBL10 TaxID=2283269 RepID=A0A385EBJ7_9CAUD|nr:hypothetical protein HOT99_gp038 [Caulobacter phage CcrBL10]AXQ68242.1 hypothetical protein CcrBL10_gp038 [Caulobacter phage CcrBL10]
MILHIFPEGDYGVEWEVGDRGRVRDATPEELGDRRKMAYHRLKGSFGKEFVVTDVNPRDCLQDSGVTYLTRRILVGLQPGKFSKEGWPCPILYAWDMEPLFPKLQLVMEPADEP